MSKTWEDYDNDDDLDWFFTNRLDKNNGLYRDNSARTCSDIFSSSGIVESSLGKTCWGIGFFDYDNDSHLDLYWL